MWPGSYLHSWRKKPQGVEYVDPGENIQQALDRAHFVILAEGEHTAVSGLTVRDGQWFSGVGLSSKLVLGGPIDLADNTMLSQMQIKMQAGFAAHGYAIRAQGANSVTIREVLVDGDVLSQTYGPADNGQSGIGLFSGTTSVVIENCKICNFGKDCVYVSGASDVQIGRSTFLNFARGGVTSVDCDGLEIDRCLFEGGDDLPTVIGNHGVWLEPDNAQGKFERVTVRGCTFRDIRRGVFLHNAQECYNSISEENNTYIRCAYNAIWAYYVKALLSKGSIFVACGTEIEDGEDTGVSDSEGALVVFNSTSVKIKDHRFFDCGGLLATVYLGLNTRGCRVEDNTFEGDLKSAIYANTVIGSKTRRCFARNYCVRGSQTNQGNFAAIVLAGTPQNPIDSDDVVENTVSDSYAAVRSATNWTGGRDTLNQFVGEA
jgi:hypothetical protein